MNLTWHRASVELNDGYTITDADGRTIRRLAAARIAIEGGFVHIQAPDADSVQVVSAPAVKRLTYSPAHAPTDADDAGTSEADQAAAARRAHNATISLNEVFSPQAERDVTERILGDRRHGI